MIVVHAANLPHQQFPVRGGSGGDVPPMAVAAETTRGCAPLADWCGRLSAMEQREI